MSANKNISSSHTAKETKQLLLTLPDKKIKKTKATNRWRKKLKRLEIPNQISAIAEIIKKDWKTPHPWATSSLDFMLSIEDIGEMYIDDSAVNIVQDFLDSADSWQSLTAWAVKCKLTQLIREQNRKQQTN